MTIIFIHIRMEGSAIAETAVVQVRLGVLRCHKSNMVSHV